MASVPTKARLGRSKTVHRIDKAASTGRRLVARCGKSGAPSEWKPPGRPDVTCKGCLKE